MGDRVVWSQFELQIENLSQKIIIVKIKKSRYLNEMEPSNDHPSEDLWRRDT